MNRLCKMSKRMSSAYVNDHTSLAGDVYDYDAYDRVPLKACDYRYEDPQCVLQRLLRETD